MTRSEYYREWREKNKDKAATYAKIYNKENKEKLHLGGKVYYQKNKERIGIAKRAYYQKNKERIRQYRINNKEKISCYIRAYAKTYRENNGNKIRGYHREYIKSHKQTDVNFKLACNLRIRISQALKNNYKSKSTTELLGCSIEELKNWLESQFQEGMSWSNYGEWHLDHVYPCAKFNLEQPYEQKICFNWFNLSPLWARENIQKSDKINI